MPGRPSACALRDAARLLSSSGGGTTFLVSDDRRVHAVASAEYVQMVRHALGMVPVAATPVPHRCPICILAQDAVRDDPTNDAHLALADHIPHCPVCALATQLHDVVRSTLVQLLKEHTSLSARSIIVEPTGLTNNARRPADVLLRNSYGQNKHLVLDVGVMSCLTNSGLQQGADSRRPRVSNSGLRTSEDTCRPRPPRHHARVLALRPVHPGGPWPPRRSCTGFPGRNLNAKSPKSSTRSRSSRWVSAYPVPVPGTVKHY